MALSAPDINTKQSVPLNSMESVQPNCESEEELEGNSRYILNKAMVVDPKDRAAVQARRLEVNDEARDRGVILNQAFTSFEPDFWKKVVHSLFLVFNPKYGWSRDITEKVIKSICTDTSRNERIRVKKRKLMQSESSSAPLPAGRPRKQSATKQIKKTLLRRPNSKNISKNLPLTPTTGNILPF